MSIWEWLTETLRPEAILVILALIAIIVLLLVVIAFLQDRSVKIDGLLEIGPRPGKQPEPPAPNAQVSIEQQGRISEDQLSQIMEGLERIEKIRPTIVEIVSRVA